MKKILALGAVVAVVMYVLGARDGGERLARVRESLRKRRHAVDDAVDSAAEVLVEKFEAAQDRASDAVATVADAAHHAMDRAAKLAESAGDTSAK